MPGKYLLLATLLIALITLVIPYLPFSSLLSFQFMPKSFLIALALILISYITLAEIGKNIFYRSEAKR
jgi:Mg2+-importing ATPase